MECDLDLSFQSPPKQGSYPVKATRRRSQEVLISEDDQIDAIFHDCDKDSTGKVTVSSLVEYLRDTTAIEEDECHLTLDDLDDLSSILDPSFRDVEVDVDTYKNGIKKWIQAIRERNLSGSDVNSEDMSCSLSPANTSDSSISPSEKSEENEEENPWPVFSSEVKTKQRVNGVINSPEMADCSFGTLEASGGDLSFQGTSSLEETEKMELMNKIANLQHQLKKLSEANINQQRYLDISEENISQITLENESLKKKVFIMQDALDKSQTLLKENEELKTLVASMRTSKKTQNIRLQDLGNELSRLRGLLADKENKLERTSEKLEFATVKNEELKQLSAEQQMKIDTLQSMIDVKETSLLQSSQMMDDLKKNIEELSEKNECMKKEIIELEQSRMDIAVGGLLDSETDEEDMMPVRVGPTSTPVCVCKQSSILREIQDVMNEDSALHLPSPICDKFEESASINLDDSSFDVDRVVATIMSTKQHKRKFHSSSKMVGLLHRKLNNVMKQLQELRQVQESKGKHMKSEVMMRRLERNLHSMSHQLTNFDRENQQSEVVVKKLKLAVKRLKADHDEMSIQYEKAMEKMDDFALTADTTLDVKLVLLKESFEQLLEEKKRLHQELEASQLTAAVFEEEAKEMMESRDRLMTLYEEEEKKIEELRSANLENPDDCKYLSEISQNLEVLKRTSKLEFQEMLVTALTTHGVDIKDIWRLVQKDVENECSISEEKSTPNTVSEDSVKDQAIKDISQLKTQLAKRQLALAALSSKTLSLGDVVNLRESPDSPLIEALVLEKFIEASKRKSNKQNSSSIHSFLSTKETSTSTASLVSKQHHAHSCPQLPANAALVACSTQTDEATDASNSISGLSTTESYTAVTSDSVNMQVNSVGQSKCLMAVLSGQDTVQSVALQAEQRVQGSQSPGLSRERSSSFKAAIEKSQSMPIQSQYYPAEGDIISSADTTPDVATSVTQDPQAYLFQPQRFFNLGNLQTSNSPVLPVFDINFSFSELNSDHSQVDTFIEEINPNHTQEADMETGAPGEKDIWSSPRHGRKLSTLVEEVSDAEPEESLTESGTAAEGQTMESSPAHWCYSPQISFEETKVREKSPSVLPPEYRSPPEYRKGNNKEKSSEFRLTKQDHISPGNTPRNLSPVNPVPPTDITSLSKPPKSSVTFKLDTLTVDGGKSKAPPTPFRLTASHSRGTQFSPISTASPVPGTTTIIAPHSSPHITRSVSSEIVRSSTGVKFKLEKSHSDEGVRNFGVQTSPVLLRTHLFFSESSEDTVMSKPKYTSPPEYKEPPTHYIQEDPEDIELTQADKLLNVQILEEAKKASLRHRNRRPRRMQSSSDISSDNSMSFEDSMYSEDSQDYHPLVPPTKTKSYPENASNCPPKSPITLSPKKPRSLKQMKVGFNISEPESEVKREIIQGLNTRSDQPSQDTQPSRTFKGGQLAKIREEHLKKRGLKHVSMPELAETSETESGKGSGGSMDSDSDRSSHGEKMGPEVNITQNPIYPSLPDHYLKKLGVQKDSSMSPDQLSEQELEEKFASISLAFKTDKQTLNQRVQLQERARDMAEQNVEKEIDGIRKAIKELGLCCSDAESRDIVSKLQQHIEVLEQSTARVSSRAELHGAVQQEDRMSRAIEIMVCHTEQVRVMYERAHQELEETRKLLQENRILPPGSGDFDTPLTKRSLSITGGQGKTGLHLHHHHSRNHPGNPTSSSSSSRTSLMSTHVVDEAGKRRASVAAFPRLFGSLGSTSGNLQIGMRSEPAFTYNENPKQKFQSIIASTATANSVTDFLRRTSQDKSKTPPPTSTSDDKNSPAEQAKKPSPPSSKSSSLSPDDALKPSQKDSNANECAKRLSSAADMDEKEQIFQKGFEQGVRTSMSSELNDLREQQTVFCESLEDLMEQHQDDEEDEEENKEHILDKLWQHVPEWDKSGKRLRFIIASIVFMMGILCIIFTVMPVSAAPVPRTSVNDLGSKLPLKKYGKHPI